MVKRLAKRTELFLRKIIESKHRALLIVLILYLIFLLVSSIYSPWSDLLDGAHAIYDTSNEKHNFIFVRSIFYGISDMLDFLLWGDSRYDVIVIGAIILSAKDVVKEKLLALKHSLKNANSYDQEHGHGRFLKNVHCRFFGKTLDDIIMDFFLDNILVYLSTILVYLYFAHADYVDAESMQLLVSFTEIMSSMQNSGTSVGPLISAVMLIVFFLWEMAILFIPALYAFPNLLKLSLYTGFVFVCGNGLGLMQSDEFFDSAVVVFVVSSVIILAINGIVDFISNRISENMYTLAGIKQIWEIIWDFIRYGLPDLPLRFIILMVVSVVTVLIDMGLIYLIMRFLS